MTDASHRDHTDPLDGAAVDRPGPVGVVGAGASGERPQTAASSQPPISAAGRRLRFGIAALLFLAVAALGAYLLFTDGRSPAGGGAEEPSEALSGVVAAILDDDPGAVAALLDPAEAAVLDAAKVDPLTQLVPLTGLDNGASIADFAGADVDSIGLRITAEPIRPGIEGLQMALGSVQGTVDVPALRFAKSFAPWLRADWLDSSLSSPIVAVHRDGRWYISVAYTVAERVRRISGRELPDLDERPPAIGASSPAAAGEAVMSELLALDAQRLVGMLDPIEAAAVYDYWPLLGTAADAAANRLLAGREAEGWAWDTAVLSPAVVVEDGTATLRATRLHVSGSGSESAIEIHLDPGGATVALRGRDLWGDPTAVELSADPDGGCSVTTGRGLAGAGRPGAQEGPAVAGPTETAPDSSAGAAADVTDTAATATQRLCSAASAASDALVFTEVDGRWYLSPTLTARRGSFGLVELLGSAGMNQVIAEVLAELGAPVAAQGSPLGSGSGTPAPAPPQRIPEEILVLLSPQLGEPDWSYALTTAADVAYEISLWLKDFGIEAASGIYAYFEAPEQGAGGTAIVVVATADAEIAAAALAEVAVRVGSETLGGFDTAVYETDSTAGTKVLVAADEAMFVLAGSLGADPAAAHDLLAAQLQRG